MCVCLGVCVCVSSVCVCVCGVYMCVCDDNLNIMMQ